MGNFESNPLMKSLHTVVHLARTDMEKRFAKANVGITPLQFGVLTMTKRGAITMNEIAHKFNFKAPSLVPAIDALEKSGLLHRKPDLNDRRKILLLITPKGQEILKRLPLAGKDDALSRAYAKFSSPKQKQLLQLLEELIGNFS